MAFVAARRTSDVSSRSALARCGLMTFASSSRLPSVEVAASRTSACLAASSGVSRANAGCAAVPRLPSVCAAIVWSFGDGSSSKAVSAGTASAAAGPWLPISSAAARRTSGSGLFNFPIDDWQRFATPWTQGTNGIHGTSLHPSLGVVEQARQITEQAVIAWCRLKEDADGLDANPRGFVLEHGTHRRYAFARSRTEVSDGREERGLDLVVGVVQTGRQLLPSTGSQGANLSQCQGRTLSDARLWILDRLREQHQSPAGRSGPGPPRSDRCGCSSAGGR